MSDLFMKFKEADLPDGADLKQREAMRELEKYRRQKAALCLAEKVTYGPDYGNVIPIKYRITG